MKLFIYLVYSDKNENTSMNIRTAKSENHVVLGENLKQSYDTHSLTTVNSQSTFHYTKITGRLRTVGWSDRSHPTAVVNLRFLK